MYVGLIPLGHHSDVKVIANSQKVIANGILTQFQVFSAGITFQFIKRLSETEYNTTVGVCTYGELCSSYPFTYSTVITSRETTIPSNNIFITFKNVIVFSVSDTIDEYTVNSIRTDEITDASVQFVVKKGEEIPTSFPGVAFHNPPKLGGHYEKIYNLYLTPQDDGEFYHLKYSVDWYYTFPLVSNCSVVERRPEFNNEYIVCPLPVRTLEMPVDFDKEKILASPDEMAFQLF